MTPTSAAIDHCEGYWIRKWIIFGAKEWTPPHYTVRSGSFPDRELTEEQYSNAVATQKNLPVLLVADHRRCLWWFRDRFYYHPNSESDPEVVKGLIIQKLRRDERPRQRAIETAKDDSTET